MSRHLTSNPLANSGELDQLRRQLGMHVKAPESTRSAMAAMHANAQKKDAEKALRDCAVSERLITPMSQYTDEEIDVMISQGKRYDEKEG